MPPLHVAWAPANIVAGFGDTVFPEEGQESKCSKSKGRLQGFPPLAWDIGKHHCPGRTEEEPVEQELMGVGWGLFRKYSPPQRSTMLPLISITYAQHTDSNPLDQPAR